MAAIGLAGRFFSMALDCGRLLAPAGKSIDMSTGNLLILVDWESVR